MIKSLFLFFLFVWMFGIQVVKAQKEHLIAVETENLGLYLHAEAQKELKQLYFGKKLRESTQLLQALELSEPAYPAFGNGLDVEQALQVVHADGNPTTRLVYHSYSVIKMENFIHTKLELKDEFYPLFVSIHYQAYSKEDVIETWVELKNGENAAIRISKLTSGYLNIQAAQYFLTHFYGSWSWEMNVVEEQLLEGTKVIDQKQITRSQRDNPAFMLSLGKSTEKAGEVIAGALAWSGSFRMAFQIDNYNKGIIAVGLNTISSEYLLDAQKTLLSPKFILTFSSHGKGEASRNLHRWARRHHLPPMPPKGLPIVLNNWEGTGMDFDEATILRIIDDAADLGTEIFVLDDGWFGRKYQRNKDDLALGDWMVNKTKLPKGLKPFITRCKQKGIKFGIWIEPEMVNSKSEFAEQHPDWIIRSKNREPLAAIGRGATQQIVDLANPKVQDFVFSVADNLLTAYPEIAYIKWDCNHYATDFGSTYLTGDRQQNLWIDYVNGYYKVMGRLREKYPHVIWQACSSGGGRLDYGALDYSHEVWTSDNTDAWSRVFIQWGSNMIYPAIVSGAHISASPNQATGNVTPIKMRMDVAMSGRLGVELQPAHMTTEEKARVKQAISDYKNILRPLVQFGDLYRMDSPYEKPYASLMYVDEQKSKAALFVYVLTYTPNDVSTGRNVPILRMEGLDPLKKYRIEELNVSEKLSSPSVGKVFSGDYLMKVGIQYSKTKLNESSIFYISEI